MEPRLKPKFYFLLAPVIIALMGFLIMKPGKNLDYQSSSVEPPDHELFTKLLNQYVDNNGFVDYENFTADIPKLEQYLRKLEQNPPNSNDWTREEKLAYWINAYNAFTIKLILDHYPLSSIKDIGSTIQIPLINTPWDISFIEIGDKKMTLNDIEHRILRKQFDEPRIHFAIVCASISCPRLRKEAYTPSRLNEQLNEQALDFINDTTKNEIQTVEIRISKIFKWFSKDFTDNGTLIDYLNKYSNTKISSGAEIDYLEYNWNLNESSGTL